MFKKLRHATNQFAVDQIIPQHGIVEHPGSAVPLDCQDSGFSKRHQITQPLVVREKSGRRHVTAPMRCRLRATTRMGPRPDGDLATSGNGGLRRGSVEQCNSSPVYSLRPGTAKAKVDVVVRRVVAGATGRAEVVGGVGEATAANDPV